MKHRSVARFFLAAAGVLATSGIAAAQVQQEVLHAFTGADGGATPSGALVEGPDGALYGTAEGGVQSRGVAFRLTLDGAYTVLHAFAGGIADGDSPRGLILGVDGNFYGTSADVVRSGAARRTG
jgi:uncharacterized repeat protein (TIGR03803 family)